MKGRVAIMKEQRKPFEIREFDVPDPEPGAVLLKIKSAGLCGSDLHSWRGDSAGVSLPPAGRPMGHEGFGVVHALGKGVSTDFRGLPLKEGDRVVFPAVYSCGHCVYCLNGDTNLCAQFKLTYKTVAAEYPFFVSTYSDFLYVPPMHPVFRVPNEVADDEVVSLNCAMGTVYQGLKLANLRVGQSVVVQGAGGLGQYAIAFAKDMGAQQIIAIDTMDHRLEMAKEMGANHVINAQKLSSSAERVTLVKEMTDNQGADVVLELAGIGELVQEGISMLRSGGAFMEIGNIVRGRTAVIEPTTLLRKRIIGSSMYRPAVIPEILDFLVRNHGKCPIHKVISHKFSLSDIDKAFNQADWASHSTSVIRAAITP